MHRRTPLAALAAALLVVLTCCGVSVQGTPQRVDVAATPDVPVPTVRRTEPVQIYLLRDGRLVSVVRFGSRGQDALNLLAAGPTPAEAAAGIGTALSPQRLRLVGEQEDATAAVDVTEAFAALSGRSRLLAVAQLVWTVTERCCIAQVRVLLHGSPVALPTDIGLTKRPVRRSDYRSVAPEPP